VPNFDLIFGGETGYIEGSNTFFPDKKYVIIDSDRTRWPISGTAVRSNPYKYWDYIVGSARPFFAKKVLITGTESCGKTTMVKKLAKIYYTSWSEELGRHYSKNYLGGDEGAFIDNDFVRIAHLQYEQDMDALNKANRVCFFDTDAVVTQYYAQAYLGHKVERIENYFDPSRYDVVFLMKPDVKWVDDGLRFLGEEEKRWKLHYELKKQYLDAGFDPNKIISVSGNYEERLNFMLEKIDALIN
jgi:HTH-type transcriptional repressor of NAD biosynthesis genes